MPGWTTLLIELDGPEVPIMDGSAAPFSFLLECAGVISLNTPRKVIEIRRPVRVTDGAAFAELRPFEPEAARKDCCPDAGSASIDRLHRRGYRPSEQFLAPDARRISARPWHLPALSHWPAISTHLREIGLARGGSLDNAIVVDGAKVLNPGGLRMKDEFAAHKLLDAVGDLALAGAALHGRFIAHRPGHALNNKLLKALFARQSAWADVTRQPEDAAVAA